jgi:hypothetical protein
MCAPAAQEIIAGQTQPPAAETAYVNQRPPTKLVPIKIFFSTWLKEEKYENI